MHSRLIAWLKILLPLGALALLSTIFLYSRNPSPISTVPVFSNGTDPGTSVCFDNHVVTVGDQLSHAFRGQTHTILVILDFLGDTNEHFLFPCSESYFAVGMTNSAPSEMLSGQRCMMDFCLV